MIPHINGIGVTQKTRTQTNKMQNMHILNSKYTFQTSHGLNQWPFKFCPETNKKTTFFIIERLEVFKPIQITRLDFLDTIVPFNEIEDKNTTHRLPLIIASRILIKNYTHPFCD
jgi:hypothetical protein